MTQTLYAMVVVDENGMEMTETYKDKMNAMIEINKLERNIKLLEITDFKVYLSEVKYDENTKKIIDDKWINDKSELKITC
ncbi:hypothetical protein BUY35_07220 [Staphylococcus cohnii]|nr:hypothetical protein BUY35_07220 [Staphylococcus cohnii]